jgi:hypothetical protein
MKSLTDSLLWTCLGRRRRTGANGRAVIESHRVLRIHLGPGLGESGVGVAVLGWNKNSLPCEPETR